MVSRRTASVCSMRRSDHPSRPSARICCCLSLSKTLLIPAKDYTSIAFVNVSIATGNGRFSAVDQWPVLGVHRGLRAGFQPLIDPFTVHPQIAPDAHLSIDRDRHLIHRGL